MPALKDIIGERPGLSALVQSPLWHQDVSTIVPAQIYAFVAKMKLNDRLDEGETAVELALAEVTRAVAMNEIPVPPMLSYYRHQRIYLTAGEFKRGLVFLDDVRAAAILFALETGMDAMTVTRLTHQRLAAFRENHILSDLAEACLQQSPRHIRSPYVFWKTRDNGMATPVFGLEEAVFDAFGLVWAELEQGYANLIMIDEDADRQAIECFLRR